MDEIQKKLFLLSESDYKKFQSSLIPTINESTVIGVRVPAIRRFAKEIKGSELAQKFLLEIPHKYYEENLLHGYLLEFIKDYDCAVESVNRFLPYVDNWAVCDTFHPSIFKKNTEKLLPQIYKWINSGKTYSVRYGVGLLMSFYLDEHFDPQFCQTVCSINSQEYYVNMMRAWYFATALAKQWETAVKLIEENKLDVWTHNKTIQKAVESYRIPDDHKNYLKKLKRR